MLVPYNGSLFEMRYNYDEIYPTLGDPINEESKEFVSDKKTVSNTFYSITYKVNLLASILINENDIAGESSKLLLESIQEQGDFEL